MKIMISLRRGLARTICGHNVSGRELGSCRALFQSGERHMWTKPEYTEMRFGFEVTMYIASR
jgi:coenzyme PQQ precursor peptide PqqA